MAFSCFSAVQWPLQHILEAWFWVSTSIPKWSLLPQVKYECLWLVLGESSAWAGRFTKTPVQIWCLLLLLGGLGSPKGLTVSWVALFEARDHGLSLFSLSFFMNPPYHIIYHDSSLESVCVLGQPILKNTTSNAATVIQYKPTHRKADSHYSRLGFGKLWP